MTKARGLRAQKCPECYRRGVWTSLSPFYSWVRRCTFCHFSEPVPLLHEDEEEEEGWMPDSPDVLAIAWNEITPIKLPRP